MAGTPTPNYKFPTYAETDVPDLAGAYNQAVNAIDAKIKEVADTIPSGADVPDATSTTKGIAKLYDSTTVEGGDQDDGGITPKAVDDKIGGSLTGYAPKFTATAPVTYNENKIGVSPAGLNADGTSNGAGIVTVTGKQGDIAASVSPESITVPNCKAVKDYVDAKVPTEQQAYTGTAPIVIDAGSRAISISSAGATSYDAESGFTVGSAGAVQNGTITSMPVYNAIWADTDAAGRNAAMSGLMTAYATHEAIAAATPTATTAVKGLVQLTNNIDFTDNSMATTGRAVSNAINSVLDVWRAMQNKATTHLTTEMLANLYVTPSGMVVYKAPSEKVTSE